MVLSSQEGQIDDQTIRHTSTLCLFAYGIGPTFVLSVSALASVIYRQKWGLTKSSDRFSPVPPVVMYTESQ